MSSREPMERSTPESFSETVSVASTDNLEVLQEGSIVLFASANWVGSPDSSVDLDTGTVWGSDTTADIGFLPVSEDGNTYFLQPVNSAKTGMERTRAPSFEDCREESPEFSLNRISDLTVGRYFCVLTNQGHLAQALVEKSDPIGQGSIRLQFVTWAEPFDEVWRELATKHPVTATPLVEPSPLSSTRTPEPDIPIHYADSKRLYASIDTAEISNAFLDLDVNTEDGQSGNDVQFMISRGGGGMYFSFLSPVNEAQISLAGEQEPGYEGCQQKTDSIPSASVDSIYPGLYLCARTTEGRLAQLRIEEVSPLREGWIEISFVTWK